MNRKFWFLLHLDGKEIQINADHVVYFVATDNGRTFLQTIGEDMVIDESYGKVSEALKFAFQEGY